MRRYRSGNSELSNHPFRSMFDLMVALLFFLLLVIIMMVPNNRHLDFIRAEEFMQEQVNRITPEAYRPNLLSTLVKKDPIGRQRWVYKNDSATREAGFHQTVQFFAEMPLSGTNEERVILTPDGKKAITALANVLKQYGPESRNQKWYRIDIEGHTGEIRDKTNHVEPWEKSTSIAIAVARLFSSEGLPPYVLKVSGRGQQDERVVKGDRVEIIVEYSNTGDL